MNLLTYKDKNQLQKLMKSPIFRSRLYGVGLFCICLLMMYSLYELITPDTVGHVEEVIESNPSGYPFLGLLLTV
jgi:hypothetical protein